MIDSARIRVLALASYPSAAASTRYRVTQFIAPLAAQGIDVELAPFLDEAAFAGFYARGARREKIKTLALATARRVVDVVRARRFDLVWVQREAMLIGPAWVEALSHRPFVFDFDDAVWLPAEPVGPDARLARWLKWPSKTRWLISHAAQVFAGNSFLADYARRLSPQVRVVPTVVSKQAWQVGVHGNEVPIIGWIGSHSTAPYLNAVLPVLQRLADEGIGFTLVTVGAPRTLRLRGVNVDQRAWSYRDEIADVRSFDIGIAPMPEGVWSDGKCGFKQVQYMATGAAVVTSPWAGSVDFVKDRDNAVVAADSEQWYQALKMLLLNTHERRRLGAAGRQTIEAGWCSEAVVHTIAKGLRCAA